MSRILWPSVGLTPPRTMGEMLYDAAAGLGTISQGKLDFYVDAVGVTPYTFGPVTQIRYNCYIRVVSKAYLHLLFQVTTPSGAAFEASLGTPEGEAYPHIQNETELKDAIAVVMNRPRTKDVLDYLLRVAVP